MGTAELATVAEQFGRALALEPFLATVVLGGGLVAAAGTPEQKAAILPAVAAGETLLAFAYLGTAARWSLTEIKPVGRPHEARGTGFRREDPGVGGGAARHLAHT